MNESPCDDGVCTKPALEPETQVVARAEDTTASESGSPPAKIQTNRVVHVLVVEDDTFFRQLNTEVLSHAGYAVDSAEDGAAAWEALQAHHYDLMVTDNSMPKVSGVELLRKLHAAGIALPVIMATGAMATEELNCQPALQPMATLLKPYAIIELLRVVKNALREANQSLPAAA